MFDFFHSASLSFPETLVASSFEKTSFQVRKKILETYDYQTTFAFLKLVSKDQDFFSLPQTTRIFPVQNKWIKQSLTLSKIDELEEELIMNLICAACNQVAPERLKKTIQNNISLT